MNYNNNTHILFTLYDRTIYCVCSLCVAFEQYKCNRQQQQSNDMHNTHTSIVVLVDIDIDIDIPYSYCLYNQNQLLFVENVLNYE